MPTLNWIGKEKIVTHHQDVPFHVLEHKYGFTAEGGKQEGETHSGNMIIHGDNLVALKSLLPMYEGRVDCIYIDPPYNTGEEKWIYNDNVNDPHIKKWLNEVVGKQGEDLSRHDKWLCMMYPRLVLLHQLLKSSGLIAVSINDQELYRLGVLMDDIFGCQNRLACAPWQSEPSGGKDKTVLRTGHEYVLIYSNGETDNLVKEKIENGILDKEDEWGKYRKGRELRKWGATSERSDRENLWFEIIDPNGDIAVPIKNNGHEGYWRWGKKNPMMSAILQNPNMAHWEMCKYDEGVIIDGKTERLVPFEKIRENQRFFGWNTWLDSSFGTNAEGTKEIKEIFGSKVFDTPKPVKLIKWLISLQGNEDGIVLDSFAGSGVVAQAVLELNKEEANLRKFILVELMPYAETITAERVRRAATGYAFKGKKEEEIYSKKLTPKNILQAEKLIEEANAAADEKRGDYDKIGKPKIEDNCLKVIGTKIYDGQMPGLGGAFDYYELGERLFDDDGFLNENVGTDKIRQYIYYSETGEPLQEDCRTLSPYLLGCHNKTDYYFYYDPQAETCFCPETADLIVRRAEQYIVYADTCLFSKEELSRQNVIFKKIPRDIKKL